MGHAQRLLLVALLDDCQGRGSERLRLPLLSGNEAQLARVALGVWVTRSKLMGPHDFQRLRARSYAAPSFHTGTELLRWR
jgi:hypothetical protein